MSNLYELTQRYLDIFERELEDHLKKIEKANPIPVSDIEITEMLWRATKAMKTVESMTERDDRGRYSGRSDMIPPMNYGYTGNTGRSRDRMGRYTGHNDDDELMSMLEDKMRHARSEDEALSIRNAMDALSRMK